jgi:dihydrofolate reductase
MSITIIAAIGNNGEIGLNGKLPWHCPAELEHFKRTVDGHYKIVGTKTFASLPHWCKDNRLHTFTRNENIHKRCTLEGVVNFGKTKDVFILGGAETYAAFLPYADKILLSWIHDTFEADTYFPHTSTARRPRIFEYWDDAKWVWSNAIVEEVRCKTSGHKYSIWELTRPEGYRKVQP